MKARTGRARKPRKELIITPLEPLPAQIPDWEMQLVEPALRPLLAFLEASQRDEEGQGR